ncbi:MAG: CPBP family intramembrane glutamic endopeptidase [Myxococcaceae bacterium]
MRLGPRPLTGFLAFLGYLAVFYAVWAVNGVDYATISDTADNILKWIVAPLAFGALYLVIAVTALGWWRPALLEVTKAKPRWLIVGPVFMAVAAVVMIIVADKRDTTATMFWFILIGSLLVGFCEELVTRGVLVVGFRGAWNEPKVWFVSTLLFALMHLPNWVFGAGPAALAQVGLAFASGSMLYLTRRVTGSLIFAMLLHGLWDFSAFIGEPNLIASAILPVNGILALVLVYVLLRQEKGKRLPQVGVEPPEAVAAA